MNTLFKTITCSQHENVDVVDFEKGNNIEQSIHIKELSLDMSIGVLETEKNVSQKVLVSASFEIFPNSNWNKDDITSTVSYTDIILIIKELASKGHIDLVETFAHQIIDACFKFSPKIISARVTVDKPDIIEDAGSVGCTISKKR